MFSIGVSEGNVYLKNVYLKKRKKKTCKNNSPCIELQLQLLVEGGDKNSYQSTNIDVLDEEHRE